MTDLSAYLQFDRARWEQFREDTPLTLSEEDLARLHGVNQEVSLQEVEEIYLPLSRLLSLYVTATQQLYSASSEFLRSPEPKVPYIIGVAGSVAVGKSTTSRVLQSLLSHWPNHPEVALVTTDGFLFNNEELEKRNLMSRKGFPESYDLPRLLRFLGDIKAGEAHVTAPLYSHHIYDIVPDEVVDVKKPDIVIVEGLNILQSATLSARQQPQVFVSDFFDFTIFVDAEADIIKQWFIDRVWTFCQGPFQKPTAYFHALSKLNHEEAIKFASKVWHEINEINLQENVLPFRDRAQLILRKQADHSVSEVLLRKL